MIRLRNIISNHQTTLYFILREKKTFSDFSICNLKSISNKKKNYYLRGKKTKSYNVILKKITDINNTKNC